MSPPRTIGQYRIAERLATGGAGEVYAGIDTKVGREVAIKFLRPELASDPDWVDRFLAEAKSLGRLNHPNIATLYALPQEDDHVCMIMELVRGRTIEQIIEERRGPLGTKESLAILAQVADGISYAHERGVIHRDIKPSNLMVTESGRVKIMDFGIARVRGSDRMTRVGTAVGTALYMSPEQFDGFEGDERSDIYSLAIVLYELLAGAPPFKGKNEFELSRAHRGTRPPPLIPRIAGVEPPLESAIMTALAKRPEQRFPSMRSFSDATGATVLRGDATGIVKNQTCRAPGQAAADEPPKHAPLHTVVVALMRSRAAAIARRFRGFHPAVQGVSVVGVLAMAIFAAVLLRPEPGPIASDPKLGLPESVHGDQPRQIPIVTKDIDQVGLPQNKAQTESFSGKSLSPTNCDPQFPTGGCVPRSEPSDRPQMQQRQAIELNPLPQTGASKNQGGNNAKLDAADDRVRRIEEGLRLARSNSPKDVAQAIKLIYPLANGGYPLAMTKLGKMYYDGTGVNKNPKLAVTWLIRAAEKEDGEAMYNLGKICNSRDGELLRKVDRQLCQSAKDAKEWCQKALKAGFELAQQCLDELGEKVGD